MVAFHSGVVNHVVGLDGEDFDIGGCLAANLNVVVTTDDGVVCTRSDGYGGLFIHM